MAKTLLRSGNLDDYQAVGGGGQAVFDSALQIRETLRLRKQQAMVDCLAIPQINDNGDRVDWYSPIEGKAVAWKAADEEARFRALRYLGSTLENAAALSRKSLQSGKTSLQLFGSLLEKAIQFPGENHVFLVDGKPVITFWGFVNLNENPRDDVLDCLRLADIPPVVTVAEPEQEEEIPPGITFAEADAPLLTPVVELAKPAEPEPQPPVIVNEPEVTPPLAQEKPARRLPLWSLPVAAVIIAAIVGPLLWKQQTTQPVPAAAAVEVAKIDMAPLPALASALPLHRAEVTPAAKKEKPVEGPVVIAAIPKDALVMDANQMKAGTTRFLNGNWRVMVDVKDPVSGKAPSLRYQIQANKGTARVVHGDNIVCRAEIFSGLHQSGELMIKSRGNARCTDGSRYPMPEITCKAGTNDVAACTARYDDHAEIPLTIKKIGA
ncbi:MULTISPECIES: SrfA family protein [Citrobacter]|uniref:SrfA family protein n=1 Tax=Citrobacter TaxID=544 RepID=UPI0005CD3FAC|nr:MULTISPECIES: SrfA family protein [Citrobacter]KAE9750306.1 ssrAB-activated protein [Enterobacteriaceae bacterium TzEc058]MDT3760075.1 SrfA family protein [Citrobacter freundii complex sp. 2023EL-00962]QAR65352.1 ssrAB-activated protein [Citrobacter sp. SL156]AKL16608.1 ssrAB-activated protein [Citrobacter freundii]AKL55158.1 ssrAB-activated protein [Citrobacter freundii]